MDRRTARTGGAPTASRPAALDHLVAASDLASEVQCPTCGWCSRWPAVDDDRPTVAGAGCPRCGSTWHAAGTGPAPDVVVDAAVPSARRVDRT